MQHREALVVPQRLERRKARVQTEMPIQVNDVRARGIAMRGRSR